MAPHQNGKLTPNQITSKNGKNVWWQCEKGHEWEAKISNRTNTNSKCPTCTNRKLLSGYNDLATTHPNLAAEFHPTLNGELTPHQITAGQKQNIWWQCKKNHEWETSPSNRSLLKTQCPMCQANTYVSSSEKELTTWLKTLNIKTETSNRNIIKGEIDIYLPDHKIAIEYNGLYWHTEQAGKQKNYHRNKWEQCNQQNIQLIQIWEDDWKQNSQLIKSMLTHKLGISKQPTIYARNTIIKTVPAEQAEKFLTTHHLQGYRPAKYWGLYTKTTPQTLIAILGTQTREQTIEIIRYATKNKIPGGFTKLLHHIIKQHPTATKIITYSHNDHSTGSLYQNAGFTKKHTGKPGYSYWKNGWTKRQNRLKYSPKNIQKNPTLTYHPNTTETQLAELNNLKRIWDTGSTLWEKTLQPNQPI